MVKRNIHYSCSFDLELFIDFDPFYIADVEGEINVDFEIDVPDFVVEVPGPTGPSFDLGGGGVSMRTHSHFTKANTEGKRIKEKFQTSKKIFAFDFSFAQCECTLPESKIY